MPVANSLSRQGARRWPSLPALTPTIVAIGCGVLLGVTLLVVAQWPTRWLVYMLSGVVAGVLTLAGHIRRQLIIYFIIATSLNVHYFLTHPEPLLFYGISAPRWFSIPLVLLPAFCLVLSILADSVSGRLTIRLRSPVTRAALLFIGASILSTLLSPERRYGVYAVFEMMQFFLIYCVALNIVQDENDFQLIFRCLLAVLTIQCIVFVIQTATGATFTMTGEITRASEGEGLVRASGTVGTTPSGYAIFIEPLLFTCLALWRSTDLDMSRRRIGLLTAVASATLILTLNRTSWITIILGSCIVEMLSRRRGIAKPISGRLVAKLVGFGLVAAVVIIPLIIPRLEVAHEDDWNIRRNLMRIAIRMIAGNPIVGVGPGAYIYHLRQYAPADVMSQWLWVVHNEYLLVWSERGIIGLVTWLLWMRAGFRQAVAATKTQTPRFRSLGIGCSAALIGLCWEYTLNMYPPFCCYALWWCLFGILVAGNRLYAPAASAALAGAS